MAHDLHALLVNAKIDGPYVLVGHSMGGLLVRVFADQYPKEVVGLVLEDAAHPDMGRRLMDGLPPKTLFESKAIKTTRQYFTYLSTSNGRAKNDPEGVDLLTSNEQVRAVKPLGDLPLVVISRSPDNPNFDYIPSSLPVETNASLRQIWQDLQADLADLSSNSSQVVAASAGHAIHREEPALVIDAINKVVEEARSRMGDASLTNLTAEPMDAAAHTPRILRVVERQEIQKDRMIIHEDVYFVDDAGDAVFFKLKVISVDPPLDYSLSDDIITASAEEQKQGGLVTSTFTATDQVTFVMEGQIIDQAFNLSEPVRYTLSFSPVQRKSSSYLTIGLGVGLALVLFAGWLLVRRRGKRDPVFPA